MRHERRELLGRPAPSGSQAEAAVVSSPKHHSWEGCGLGPGLPRYSPSYDVSPDGQRFALPEPLENPSPPAIHVVENWLEEFRDQQPGSP